MRLLKGNKYPPEQENSTCSEYKTHREIYVYIFDTHNRVQLKIINTNTVIILSQMGYRGLSCPQNPAKHASI